MNRKESKIFLFMLMFLLSTVLPVSAAMVRLPFEQLMSESDIIITGNTTDVTQSGIYQYFRVEIENYYKSPETDSTIYVKVKGGQGMWFEDQPELKVGKKYLLFLTDTDESYLSNPVYTVYGLFQGVYTVESGFATGHPSNLIVTEDSISLAPPGNLSMVKFWFPEDLPVHELDTALMEFQNNGGQTIHRQYNVLFKGVEGPCIGIDTSEKIDVHVHAGGGTQKGIEVNFTLPGVYDVFLNNTFVEQVTVYDAGHGAEDVVFSDFRTDPARPLVNRNLRFRFNVTYNGSSVLKCYYRFVVTPINGNQWFNIPMVSKFNGSETRSSGYEIRPWDDVDLRVVVWYKGQRVIDELVEVVDDDEEVPDLGGPLTKITVTREMAEELAVEAFMDSLIDPYEVEVEEVRKIQYEYPVESGNFTDAWYVSVCGKGIERGSGELVGQTTDYTILIYSGEIVEGITAGAGLGIISTRDVILDGVIKFYIPITLGLGTIIVALYYRRKSSSI
jgi:hypothetical protein